MRLPSSPPTLAEPGGPGAVRLRAHRPEDLDGLLAQCRDELSARWTSQPLPYRRADGEQYLAAQSEQWSSGRYLGFAIEVDGEYAGTVDLRPRRGDVAEIGYGLAPWARGRGLTPRALRLVLPWAFDEVGLHTVHWMAAVGNWPSRRVAWSVGFHIDCRLPEWWDQRGQARTAWFGALRRGEQLSPAHPWFAPPVLHHGPVTLRRHHEDDDVAMAEACSDPQTQYWLPQLPRPYSVRRAREHLAQIGEHQARGQVVYWAVAEAHDPDGPLRGEIGLQVSPDGHQGEVGYWIHPVARGRGLARAAVTLAARHALLPVADGGLGLARLLLRTAEHNTASQRIARRVGFQLAGVDRDGERLRDGTVQHMLRFDLLRSECP